MSGSEKKMRTSPGIPDEGREGMRRNKVWDVSFSSPVDNHLIGYEIVRIL